MPATTLKILNVHTSCRLFYRDGTSDKEYHASINEVETGCTVTFAFGRRGSALTTGTKTTTPVPLEKAQQIYNKLISEKTAKGYTQSGSGALFAAMDYEKRISGLVPQLLNSIEEHEAPRYIADEAWCLQEKFDGRRLMAAVKAGQAKCSNRKGLYIPLLQEVETALCRLPDCTLDGEMVGDSYIVFDLLSLDEANLRAHPYKERFAALASAVQYTEQMKVSPTAWDRASKKALYDQIAQAGGEGVVFKKADGPSIAGRPASGGSQVKCKFYATCTCLVAAQNDQRSVRLALLDECGSAAVVGNVTIPSNKAIPDVGALVEIRYLYAYKGGSLYQPAYLGERDDLVAEACVLGQLKYKPAGYAAEFDEG